MSDTTEPSATPAPARRWPIVLLACLAVAALAFAIGRFTAFGTGGAGAAVPDAADAGFARDMQVHHAQAIDMAMIAYRRTDDEALRTLAYDIATGQSAQKGQMFGWLVQWGLPQAGAPLMSWMTDDEHAGHGAAMTDDDRRAAMGMATDAELTALREATGTPADCLFLSLMIRHHEGAVAMVDAVLKDGSQPVVLQTATSMKETQTAEIDAMQSMRERLACQP